MKILVGYSAFFEVEVPEKEFYAIYHSSDDHLTKGDKYAVLAYQNSEAIRKFISIDEQDGEIIGVYNPCTTDSKGNVAWDNDDEEVYWEP